MNSYKHGDTEIDDYNRAIQGSIDPAKRRTIMWEAEKYIVVDLAY